MFQFTCNCLNVNIVTNKVEPVDLSRLSLPSTPTDAFFQIKLYETLSNSTNIILAQSGLCTKRQVGQVLITTCLCCEQDSHATLNNNERILINSSLKKDAQQIEELEQLPNYSKLYKMILPMVSTPNLLSSSFESKLSKNYQLGDAIQSIWQRANNYLCQEQKLMEERIRVYTENQYTEYNNLQSKIMKEKQILIDLHQNRCGAVGPIKMSLPLSLGQFPSPPTSPDYSEKTSNENATLSKSIGTTSNAVASNIIKHRQDNVVNRKRAQSIHTTTHLDSSILFDIEGFEDEPPAFPVSDEEADTDDSTVEEATERRIPQQRGRKTSNPLYASSLPITVPLWSPYTHPDVSDEKDAIKNPSPDPQLIAASMQALAMIGRDGKDMFGDLPRRRLNTGDLVKSRPI